MRCQCVGILNSDKFLTSSVHTCSHVFLSTLPNKSCLIDDCAGLRLKTIPTLGMRVAVAAYGTTLLRPFSLLYIFTAIGLIWVPGEETSPHVVLAVS